MKVIKAFSGVKDGEVQPTAFEVGDSVDGNLAMVAEANGWAEPDGHQKQPVKRKGKSNKPGWK